MQNSKPIQKTPVVHLQPPGQGRVTPEKAKQILQQQGLPVTLQQSAAMVEFLYKLAQLTNDKQA